MVKEREERGEVWCALSVLEIEIESERARDQDSEISRWREKERREETCLVRYQCLKSRWREKERAGREKGGSDSMEAAVWKHRHTQTYTSYTNRVQTNQKSWLSRPDPGKCMWRRSQ
jgi:hypothetical protein